MEEIDFSYEISEERLRAYAKVSLYDRLRWLEDVARFTALMRTAATVRFGSHPIAPSVSSIRESPE